MRANRKNTGADVRPGKKVELIKGKTPKSIFFRPETQRK